MTCLESPSFSSSEQPLRGTRTSSKKNSASFAQPCERLDGPALEYALSVKRRQEEAHPGGTALRIGLRTLRANIVQRVPIG